MNEPQDLPPNTRVPRVFSIGGTIVYAIGSVTAVAAIIAKPWWTPPWWVLLPMFAYIFVSMGIITMGRIEANKDARVFAQLLRKQSDINKRNMN
jgi:hypothetical protein